MIIVKQSKDHIVNFNNVDSIRAASEYREDKCYIMAYINEKEICLGEYDTKERAKEILEKMINAYGLGMHKYDMPQK